MKILVNAFHSTPEKSRVNARWLTALAERPEITVNQVNRMYPDWQIDVAREQTLLEAHQRIVFQHPFFWYSVPPMMKKWLDDVLTYGWAYGPGGKALHGKQWVSAISTGGPAHSYQAGGFNTYAMSELLKPLQQTASLIGMPFLPAYVFHGAVQASDVEIDAAAQRYIAHITDPELDPQLRLQRLLGEMQDQGVALAAE